jgi:adenine-specific DNA-methyltransferase
MTDAERTLRRHLRLRQFAGYKFRRQQPIGKYIVDFVCFERKLVIELDGSQHSEEVVYDLERSAWLEEQGFRILRFWDNQVFNETDGVKEASIGALNNPSHTPTLILPHKGGGGWVYGYHELVESYENRCS